MSTNNKWNNVYYLGFISYNISKVDCINYESFRHSINLCWPHIKLDTFIYKLIIIRNNVLSWLHIKNKSSLEFYPIRYPSKGRNKIANQLDSIMWENNCFGFQRLKFLDNPLLYFHLFGVFNLNTKLRLSLLLHCMLK